MKITDLYTQATLTVTPVHLKQIAKHTTNRVEGAQNTKS